MLFVLHIMQLFLLPLRNESKNHLKIHFRNVLRKCMPLKNNYYYCKEISAVKRRKKSVSQQFQVFEFFKALKLLLRCICTHM